MEIRKNHLILTTLLAISISVFILLLFGFLYHHDNKYTAGAPYGKDGIFTFSETDLSHPLFLIDGWEFYPEQILTYPDFSQGLPEGGQTVFIGQYPNFSHTGISYSPFGEATYRITLHYLGTPAILSLEIPEIFTNYTLWVDETPVASRKTSRQISFLVDEDTQLILNVENHTHYYSGLTYPPAIGTPEIITRLSSIRFLFYAILCIVPLTLMIFSLGLWFTKEQDSLFQHFGLLCLFFSIHCLHPFIWQAKLSGTLWYAIEDTSWLLVLTETIALSSIITGFSDKSWYRFFIRPVTYLITFLCFFSVCFIIPEEKFPVNLYGLFVDGYRIFCWFYLAACAGYGVWKCSVTGLFTLSGCCILGAGLVANLSDNSRFEPIYTGWQTEYTGFFLVLVFEGLMIWRNAHMLKENQRLTQHLEEAVATRTSELTAVLNERKNFFSDMAHNLKAPISAIHGFISLIRDGDVHVDDELQGYLNLIENENLEMHRRIQALNTINAFDRIDSPVENISINNLLLEIQENNEPEAEAAGIHFIVTLLTFSVDVYGQHEKLLTLFENLIYNAISFTPIDGFIQIKSHVEDGFVSVTVSDTGCGIAPEHLPHLFERFYTIREDKQEGSGLGLYIAKITAEEYGGSIRVTSKLGEGSSFTVRLPLAPKI